MQILPYARGVYGRDTLYPIWLMIEEANAADGLFWGNHDLPQHKGDLVSFVKYFDDPNRYLLMIVTTDGSDLIGCVWFDDVVPKYRCFGSIFIKPQYRGELSREAVELCCNYAFDMLQIDSIWGVTPWERARNLCLRCGFDNVTTLPEFTLIDDKPHDVYVVKKVRTEHGQYATQGQ